MDELEQEEFDNTDEQLEEAQKEPAPKEEKRNDTGPEEVQASSGERFEVRHVPEMLGIVDTVTGEAVSEHQFESQLKASETLAVQAQCKMLNNQDKLLSSLG